MNISDLSAQLIAQAEGDPAFRKRLIEDPRTAIADFAKISIPADLEITIFQDTPTHRHLVLPVAASGELSDDDLTSVSGGGRPSGILTDPDNGK